MALYVGDSDNLVLMLGDTEVSAAYIGDLQVYPLSPFAVSPGRISLNQITLSAVMRIKSPEAWTITDNSGGWLSYSASSGTDGVTMVTVTATANTVDRTAVITVTTANYSKTVDLTQVYYVYDGFYVENVSSSSGTLTLFEGASLSHNLEYSTDGISNWTTATTGQSCTLTVPAGEKLYLRGTNSSWRASGDGHNVFGMDVDWKIGGNMLSVIDKDNYASMTTVPDYAFQNAFAQNSHLVDASDANFGVATTLGRYSLHNAFHTSNIVGLPDVSTITTGGYWCFIGGCNSCTNLTSPYDMRNITTLTSGNTMHTLYKNCSSLAIAYAPNVSNFLGYNNSYYWLYNVAASGIVVVNPNVTGIPTDSVNGIPSGWTRVDSYYSITLSGSDEAFDYATSDGRSGTVAVGDSTTVRLDYPQTLSITTGGPKFHLYVNGVDKGNGPSYTLDYLDLANGDTLTVIFNGEPS